LPEMGADVDGYPPFEIVHLFSSTTLPLVSFCCPNVELRGGTRMQGRAANAGAVLTP
jgi:hypothetical protein